MKLRCHETGKVWTITSVFASDGLGEARLFRGGFTIINDEPSTASEEQELKLTLETHSTQIDLLKQEIRAHSNLLNIQLSTIEELLSRVDALELGDTKTKNAIVTLLGRVSQLETNAGYFNP